MIEFKKNWDDGLEIRTLNSEESKKYIEPVHAKIFTKDQPRLVLDAFYSEHEKSKLTLLRSEFKIFSLHLGAFKNGVFAGWHFGRQEAFDTYYMTNSAVIPEFRRQKIYERLLESTVEAVSQLGFQKITSNHHPSNNSVIIPKLKIGFCVSGFTVTDVFGTLVQLSWYAHHVRKEAFEYRVGHTFPTINLKSLIEKT